MRQILLIAHNLRSAYNVGSLLRTADGLGLQAVWLTGYTPYPILDNDARLPHIANKVSAKIAKTALGAEKTVNINHAESIETVIKNLKSDGFLIAGLEQTINAILLPEYAAPDKLVLIVGREVAGFEAEVLALCDICLEIPMLGQKESFNVAAAAAMALYSLRFAP
jgi:23S rRNA (guanosine2251-2'-O)-methyltransferase